MSTILAAPAAPEYPFPTNWRVVVLAALRRQLVAEASVPAPRPCPTVAAVEARPVTDDPDDHAAWCVVPDHVEVPDDPDGCTSAVTVVPLSGRRRIAGFLSGRPGDPAHVVLTEAPGVGDRLTLGDAAAVAAFFGTLTTSAAGGAR